MTTKYEQQQTEFDKISAEINDANTWDDGFGGIGSGPTKPQRKTDEDFGGIATGLPAGTISNAELLRDESVIAELERRDPKFKRQQDEKRMDQATDRFKAANPDYIPNAKNYEAICKHIRSVQLRDPGLDIEDVIEEAYKKGFWTVENLSSVFSVLKSKGRVDLPAEQAKELTPEEMLIVTARVRQGKPGEAVTTFLQFSLPGIRVTDLPLDTFAVQYPGLVHKTVWTIFRLMNPQLSAEDYKAFYRSMKHVSLPTVTLLNQTLQQRNEERLLGTLGQIQNGPASAPTPSPEWEQPRAMTEEEMRALPPEELDALIVAERKAYRKSLYQ